MTNEIPEGYMSTKVASDKWGISEDRVRSYLRAYKESIGAKKVDEGLRAPWAIPCDAQRPVTEEELLRFAQDLLRYKDNPTIRFAASSRSGVLFNALCERGYLSHIEGTERHNAWSYCFTSAGYEYALNKRLSKNETSFISPPDLSIDVSFDVAKLALGMINLGQQLMQSLPG